LAPHKIATHFGSAPWSVDNNFVHFWLRRRLPAISAQPLVACGFGSAPGYLQSRHSYILLAILRTFGSAPGCLQFLACPRLPAISAQSLVARNSCSAQKCIRFRPRPTGNCGPAQMINKFNSALGCHAFRLQTGCVQICLRTMLQGISTLAPMLPAILAQPRLPVNWFVISYTSGPAPNCQLFRLRPRLPSISALPHIACNFSSAPGCPQF